jgi:hypothetical protein
MRGHSNSAEGERAAATLDIYIRRDCQIVPEDSSVTECKRAADFRYAAACHAVEKRHPPLRRIAGAGVIRAGHRLINAAANTAHE